MSRDHCRQDKFRAETDFDYSYDYAGRLLSSVNFYSQNFWDQTFTYDAAGNMRSNSHVGTYNYNAPSGAHPHAPTGVNAEVFSYDANGNMLTGLNGKGMSYDAENRPLTAALAGQTTTYAVADLPAVSELIGDKGYDSDAYCEDLIEMRRNQFHSMHPSSQCYRAVFLSVQLK